MWWSARGKSDVLKLFQILGTRISDPLEDGVGWSLCDLGSLSVGCVEPEIGPASSVQDFIGLALEMVALDVEENVGDMTLRVHAVQPTGLHEGLDRRLMTVAAFGTCYLSCSSAVRHEWDGGSPTAMAESVSRRPHRPVPSLELTSDAPKLGSGRHPSSTRPKAGTS